ncbi:MAG TPA: class I SAM-dependent methyltransferase [Thermoanaerobaculia bacterium]|jgi:predicted O-methyltransferase YrrM
MAAAPHGTPPGEGLTYEEIVDNLIDLFRRTWGLPASGPVPWGAFLRLSDRIHARYEIPSTTVTPMMRRLLFGLGFAAGPRYPVGVGTYVGYAWSWLLRDRADPETGPFLDRAIGIDVDSRANQLAARNCAALGHGKRIVFLDADGVTALEGLNRPVDLLYLDLDDERTGKSGYQDVLMTAIPHLQPGALVLAHDPCVPRFAQDFASYHRFVRNSGLFAGVWVLPVDPCGLSIALVR